MIHQAMGGAQGQAEDIKAHQRCREVKKSEESTDRSARLVDVSWQGITSVVLRERSWTAFFGPLHRPLTEAELHHSII